MDNKSALDELHLRVEEIVRDERLLSLDEAVALFRLKERADKELDAKGAKWAFVFGSIEEVERFERLRRALPWLFPWETEDE